MRITQPVTLEPPVQPDLRTVNYGVPFRARRNNGPRANYLKIQCKSGMTSVLLLDGVIPTEVELNSDWVVEKIYSNHELILRD